MSTAMKGIVLDVSFPPQFRETLTEVHGGPHDRHLPQIEEAYLQQLQRENAALRASLEEHQATLEMIMSTYRQQVGGALRWHVVD